MSRHAGEGRRPRPQLLRGRTVVVTRAEGKSTLLIDLLRSAGAATIALPTIRFAAPVDPEPMRRALDALDDYQWVIFTSSTAVEFLFDAARAHGVPDAAWRRFRFAAVGPTTATRLVSAGVRAEGIVIGAKAETLAQILLGEGHGEASAADRETRRDDGAPCDAFLRGGERCLLPQADLARAELQGRLGEAGVIVDNVIAYRTVAESPERAHELLELIRRGAPIDAVTFASPSAFVNFLEMTEPEGRAFLLTRKPPIITIGPTTSQAVTEHGFPVAKQASPYTTHGLYEAVLATLCPESARREEREDREP